MKGTPLRGQLWPSSPGPEAPGTCLLRALCCPPLWSSMPRLPRSEDPHTAEKKGARFLPGGFYPLENVTEAPLPTVTCRRALEACPEVGVSPPLVPTQDQSQTFRTELGEARTTAERLPRLPCHWAMSLLPVLPAS